MFGLSAKQGSLTVELTPYQIKYSMVSVKSHSNESHLTGRLGSTWPEWPFNTWVFKILKTVCPDHKWRESLWYPGQKYHWWFKMYLKGKAWHRKSLSSSENVKVLSSDAPWISLNYYKMRKFLLLDNLCGKLNFLKHSKATELPVYIKYLLFFLFLKKV